MIQAGIRKNLALASIIGQQLSPIMPIGQVGLTPDGESGHANAPHRAIDSVRIAAHIIVALQQLVAISPPLVTALRSSCQ